MGRGKVTLKYIQNEKDRKTSFGQRMEGLTKKVSEFSSTFGVEPCLIVYDGDDRPMTWPQDSTIVQTMLKKYEHQKIDTTPKKFDVRDYFANKKTIVEDEITRVRKKIAKKKYPTWGAFFQGMEEEQLRVCMGMVDTKIIACNQRINMLKNVQQHENISTHIMDQQEKIDVMHNIPQMQHFSNDLVKAINEEWYNQLFRLDDSIKELHNDYTNGMVDFTNDVDVQQGEFSFMLNTALENIKQHIPDDPIKKLNDNPNAVVNFINVDVPHVSSTNQIDELVVLEDFLMSEPEQILNPQLDEVILEFNHLIGEPQDSVTKLDVSHVSSANQLGEILELDNLVAEAAKPKDEDTEVVDFDDNANWISQPNVFAKQGLSFFVQESTTLKQREFENIE